MAGYMVAGALSLPPCCVAAERSLQNHLKKQPLGREPHGYLSHPCPWASSPRKGLQGSQTPTHSSGSHLRDPGALAEMTDCRILAKRNQIISPRKAGTAVSAHIAGPVCQPAWQLGILPAQSRVAQGLGLTPEPGQRPSLGPGACKGDMSAALIWQQSSPPSSSQLQERKPISFAK